MKAASQGAGISRAEEKLKSLDCYKKLDPPCNVEITLVQDIPLPSDPGGGPPIKKEVVDHKDDGGPAEVMAWLANAHKHFTPKFGAVDIKELEGMITLYLTKVSSCISKCYVPNRAAKMKRCIGDILLFFNIHYREIPEIKKTYSTYLDKMTELMSYYIDMEIQASSRAKEAPQVIASRLTLSLYTFLNKSHDHILDSVLRTNNVNRNFWELCSLLFSGVLKDTPNRILSDLTYVRYVLVYKMWKRVVQGPEERKKVMTLAALRLKHPPQFVEKTRAGFLVGIIPKIPKKRPDVTTFLIQAKFDVKEKAKAFLKYIVECKTNVMFVPTVPAIKTDIPLLVGHLPDFGPSPNLVKLEPPEIEEDENVDISGSRLMNEVWTSINHEASFREAIRMQNVTSFNKSEAHLAERKKMQRVLKQRKGRVKNAVASKARPDASSMATSQRLDVTTIVVSDESEVSDLEKELVFRPVPAEKVNKTRKHLEPRSKLKSSKKSKKMLPRDPTPPPVIEHTQSPDLPPQNVRVLTPSQIKQEIRDDVLVDDDVVLDLPLPRKYDDNEAKETSLENRNTDTISSIAGIQQDASTIEERNSVNERTARDEVLDDTLCDLKAERQSPTKDDEVNIEMNRDILERIKISGNFQNGSSCDQVFKSPASPSLEIESMSVMGIGSAKPDSSLDKRRKGDCTVSDYEESTWSPSGKNQELIGGVATNFTSTYSPNNVDNRLIERNDLENPSENSERNQAVDDDYDLDTFESLPDSSTAEESPPAKRSRLEEAEHSVNDDRVVDSSQASASHPNESISQTAGEGQHEQVAIPAKLSLHAITLQYHHSCYVEQAKFRDLCTTLRVKFEDEVPSAYFKDPATGEITQGCTCEQCTANSTALRSNFKCLAEFKAQTLVAMENEPVVIVDLPSNPEDLNQVQEPPPPPPQQQLQQQQLEQQPVVVGQDRVDAHPGEFSGAGGGNAPAQLPFKKRKAFSGRDDTESPNSDTSREEVTEPRQWHGEFPSHTPTRMFSIAALEDVNATGQAPLPVSGSSLFENAAPSHRAPSTSAMLNPGEVACGRGAGYPVTAQSTGGGFPPFSSVVPLETRPQSCYDPIQIPIPQDPVYFSHQQQPPLSDPDLVRRHFRTPAELKATFHAEPAAAQEPPWTHDLVNGAHFTHNLNSSSSTLTPETRRRSRKYLSRKSSMVNRQKPTKFGSKENSNAVPRCAGLEEGGHLETCEIRLRKWCGIM